MTRKRRREANSSKVAETGPALGRAWFGSRPRFWIAWAAAALLLRIILILATPGSIYHSDHDDYVRWGIQATDEGILTLYDKPPPRHDMRVPGERGAVITQRAMDRVCNYPPLATYLLYGSGLIFRAVSADRLINTITSRFLFCGWAMLSDILLAAGCAAVVSLLRPGAPGRWTYALMLLAPPFWWDSVIWGQTDTIFLAPAVWMLYAMLRQRWLLAGVLWGIALGLKPQGVLLLPVWCLAILMTRPPRRVLAGAVMAALVLFIGAAPFLAHSGWAWFRVSYQENFSSAYANFTTLKAFNIWYLDVLISDSTDATQTWLGLSKARWGDIFLAVGLLAGFLLVIWRWRRDMRGLIPWTGLALLAFVMLPTRVHERYLILTLPFLAIATAMSRRVWPGLVALAIVVMAQMSWPLWLKSSPGQTSQIADETTRRYAELQARAAAHPEQKLPSLEDVIRSRQADYRQNRMKSLDLEWTCTILALLGAAAAAAALLTLSPQKHDAGAHRPREK
ncbi:MAG TPA: glycosyltransferase family 87 protein [Phycisphaerae bacterium]|nr:glycosyltransferase family 87 protein [Phycisphaerae bacterium]